MNRGNNQAAVRRLRSCHPLEAAKSSTVRTVERHRVNRDGRNRINQGNHGRFEALAGDDEARDSAGGDRAEVAPPSRDGSFRPDAEADGVATHEDVVVETVAVLRGAEAHDFSGHRDPFDFIEPWRQDLADCRNDDEPPSQRAENQTRHRDTIEPTLTREHALTCQGGPALVWANLSGESQTRPKWFTGALVVSGRWLDLPAGDRLSRYSGESPADVEKAVAKLGIPSGGTKIPGGFRQDGPEFGQRQLRLLEQKGERT